MNAILLIFSLVADRHNIGIATFINLFLLGYITQFTLEFLQKVFPAPSMAARLGFLLIAIVIICFGIGTIITAFFMGPLIEFFNEKIARPLLKKD